MAKKPLKADLSLYEEWLEVTFTLECLDDEIDDLCTTLKRVRGRKRRLTRLQAKMKARYVELFDKEPCIERRGKSIAPKDPREPKQCATCKRKLDVTDSWYYSEQGVECVMCRDNREEV